MLRVRTLYPSRGWLHVLWSKDHELSQSQQAAIDAACAIPGCRQLANKFEASYTTWMLPEVHRALTALGAPLPPTSLSGFLPDLRKLARPLFEHQDSGVHFLLASNGAVLADGMGLGKTTVAAVAAEAVRLAALAGSARRGPVVIVGTRATRNVWRSELLALGILKTAEELCVLESIDLHNTCFVRGSAWYFCHFDVLKYWWSRLYGEHPVVLIVDEAHYIRNGRAQRSKATQLAAAGTLQRFLLTGTPLDSKPSELWFPLTVACGRYTWGSPNEFRVRYCGATRNGFGLQDNAVTNVEELKQRLAVAYLRRTCDEVGLDMPLFTRQMQSCDLGAFKAEHDALLASVDIKTLVRSLACGMVAQALPVLTELRKLTSLAKIPATVEQVHTALEQNESIVVFAWTRETVSKLYSAVGRIDKIKVDGSQPQAQRDDAVRVFQASKTPTALFATYGALREAVTLHQSRLVLLHDLGYTVSELLQAEKRVHRLGQRRACLATWMLAEHSVDTLIAPILQRKLSMLGDLGLAPEHEIDLSQIDGTSPSETFEQQIERAIDVWRSF